MNLLKKMCFLLLVFCFTFPLYSESKTALTSDTIDVLHYDINLDIVHLSKKEIKGFTEVTLTTKVNNTNIISLDLLELNIDSVLLENNLISGVTYNDTLLSIPLSNPIDAGDTIELSIYYHGEPVGDPAGWGGFYFTSDSSYAWNLGVGFGADPHNYGRVWYPCLDDFIDRATYDIHLRVNDDKVAVCSGTMMSIVDNGDNTKTYQWRLHDTAPTYVIGMAIGDYTAIVDTFNGVNGPIPSYLYVRPSDTAKAKASFVNLLPILSEYENYFGPYRWERVGYVGIPFNNGAMEHTTNIAYPFFAINGNLSYETLMAHELSHQWFGNMVTCASAEDMWINEGWATYCESLYQKGIYGDDAYRSHFRNHHKNVLQFTHIKDNGYRALYGVPHDYTYGSTSYDKGASVVHTLKGYLGDSLFFETVKANMSQNAFDTISSAGLRDFISNYTGINMDGFFDAWVFSPGFPHFSVDSFTVIPNGAEYDVNVFMKQKYKGGTGFAASNRVEITFMNDNWELHTETIEFSGQHGDQTFKIPFDPQIVMADLYENLGDATTDHFEVISSTGNYNFRETYSQVEVSNISDSAFVRIEHNWVVPDPLKNPNPYIVRLSDYRYWKVDGIFPAGFEAQGKFYYNRTTSMVDGYLDVTLLPNISPINPSIDSLLLLYRIDPADDWEVTNFTRTGSLTKGYIICDTLKRGEYTFAVGTPVITSLEDEQANRISGIMEVYPNPSKHIFNVNVDLEEESVLKIYGTEGQLFDSINVAPHTGKIILEPRRYNMTHGTYILHLLDNNEQIIAREKVVYIN